MEKQTFGQKIKEDLDKGWCKNIEDIKLLCNVCRKPMRVNPMGFDGHWDVIPCNHEMEN